MQEEEEEDDDNPTYEMSILSLSLCVFLFSSLQELERLVPLSHGHGLQHLFQPLQSRLLITIEQGSNIERSAISPQTVNLRLNVLAVLFVPGRHGAVVVLEVWDVAPGLQVGEAAWSGDGVAGAGGGHFGNEGFFIETSSETPVEEAASVFPLQGLANDAFGLHPSSAVVEIGKLQRNLRVDGQEERFTLGHLDFDVGLLIACDGFVGKLSSKIGIDGIQASHSIELAIAAVLDAHDALRFENTTTSFLVGVHFHALGINRRVDDHLNAY